MTTMTRRILLLLAVCQGLLCAGVTVTTQKGEILTAPRSAAASTKLSFPFVTDQAGFDTEITISNTSLDTQGSTAQAGTCVVTFYGYNAPGPGTTQSIAAGKQLVFNASQGGGGIAPAPSFQGYVMANCAFPLARGSAK